ncbi:hypothetical protein AURDEDRAFT_111473 [Auricularia subglabra TFB-10046 SS5]|nr:hypothetical protein AURDEDRAFT_111473 [Auricularia subglabra TFB-10046 SS5]
MERQPSQSAFSSSTISARRPRAQQQQHERQSAPDMHHALSMSHTPPSSRPHSQHKASYRQDQHYTPPLPDTPAFFRSDPYPNAPPSLSSSISGSTSTRSSAYTSPGSTGAADYARVAMPSSDEYGELAETLHGDTDKPPLHASLYGREGSESSHDHDNQHAEPSRWSESYTSSSRSRASSWVGNGGELKPKQSYDWHAAGERNDEMLTTDDEDTEDEDGFAQAAAVAVVEDGRGLIVHGQGVPVGSLQVMPGTTHLLLASSLTPNQLPSFLVQTLPSISSSLLALDISANFLVTLPPPLASCVNLEELNIAANPLRALPNFLSNLTSLRVLIADSTGLQTSSIPPSLACLSNIHTLSLRRNKLHALPAWLCLLPSLETLLVDGNPFTGPWEPLVQPLLTKTPMTPMYPPNTPALGTYPSDEILDDSAPPSADPATSSYFPTVEQDHEDQTVRYSDYSSRNAAPQSNSKSMYEHPSSPGSPGSERHVLTRRGTAPSRPSRNAAVVQHLAALEPAGSSRGAAAAEKRESDDEQTSSRGSLRRMRSAAEMRMALESGERNERPPMSRNGSSAASRYQNIFPANLNAELDVNEDPDRSTQYGSMSSRRRMARAHTTTSLWDDKATPLPTPGSPPMNNEGAGGSLMKNANASTKQGRWGFLKKMSMGKLKGEMGSPPNTVSPPRPRTAGGGPGEPALPVRRGLPSESAIDLTALGLQSSSSSSATSSFNPSPNPSPGLRNQPSVPSLSIPAAASLQPSPALSPPSPFLMPPSGPTPRSAKRRSFLPLDRPAVVSTADTLTPLSIPPSSSRSTTVVGDEDTDFDAKSPFSEPTPQSAMPPDQRASVTPQTRALRSVMAYLRDLSDLGAISKGAVNGTATSSVNLLAALSQDMSLGMSMDDSSLRQRRPTIGERVVSDGSFASSSSDPKDSTESATEDRKYKEDKARRAMIVREIVETERTYVKGLQELVDIYIRPAAVPVSVLGNTSGKETIVPPQERKIVFNGLESLFTFHKDSFLPALEAAAVPLFQGSDNEDGHVSTMVAITIANVFLSHAAFMKMYSTYINNFDNSIHRLKEWTKSSRSQTTTPAVTPSISGPPSPPSAMDLSASTLTTNQRKRIKAYLKRCRVHPRHSQLNLEGYLLLPIQRIPRYRLLLEELVRATPPKPNTYDDPLDRALNEISSLANNMNEGKRDAEWRKKLVQWQSRIRGKFPSPLVQPHRRLIMDGHLLLTRVVRKSVTACDVVNPGGEKTTVQVDCLIPELTPRYLVAILCNDLLVLCKDPSGGKDQNTLVDLWAVLRMQTLPQPASVVHGNVLRIVDNKAILYFDTASSSEALTWSRAINLHVPALKP